MYARKLLQLDTMGSPNPPNFVAEWIERLDPGETTTEDLGGERGKGKGEETEKEPLKTPARRRGVSEVFDEASPTNTSFSKDSIFDTPEYDRELGLDDRDDVYSASATTVYDEESLWGGHGKRVVGEQEEIEAVIQHEAALDEASVGNLESCERRTETECNSDSALSTTTDAYIHLQTAPPLDPNAPRLVWVTSCLQCTYAGLPCSRTPPACSRCKRKGNGDVCLLQRRKIGEERIRGDGVWNGMPVLLRLRGDNPETWDEKISLSDELHKTWLDKQDRENWVLPPLGKVFEGRYIDHYGGSQNKMHPGEGIGRQTFCELQLA